VIHVQLNLIRGIMPQNYIYENKNVLNDHIGSLTVIDYFGNDVTVVNNARRSFNKKVSRMSPKDFRLLRRLICDHHTSPFRSLILNIDVVAPLFVTQQWKKHIIASSYLDDQYQHNEQSLRYTDMSKNLQFFYPKDWRKQSAFNKQQSEGNVSPEFSLLYDQMLKDYCKNSTGFYKELIKGGVAREQARMHLPENTYTSFINTISLPAALHFIFLRQGQGAQLEIKLYADALLEALLLAYPDVTKYCKLMMDLQIKHDKQIKEEFYELTDKDS